MTADKDYSRHAVDEHTNEPTSTTAVIRAATSATGTASALRPTGRTGLSSQIRGSPASRFYLTNRRWRCTIDASALYRLLTSDWYHPVVRWHRGHLCGFSRWQHFGRQCQQPQMNRSGTLARPLLPAVHGAL